MSRPLAGLPPIAPSAIGMDDLALVADTLIGCENGAALLRRLEELLQLQQALPAQLYLYDGDAGSFYPAAGIGCPVATVEISASALEPRPPGWHLLSSRGRWVGLLAIHAEPLPCPEALAGLGIVLGPMLIAVHGHERTLDAFRQAREELAQFTSAGQLLRHLDVDILLVRLLETLIGAVGAEVGAVVTVEEDGSQRCRTCLGLREDHALALRYRDGPALIPAVLASRQAVCMDSAAIGQQLDLEQLSAHLTGLLVLPLTTEDRCHGLVILANPEIAFSAGSQRIAETVCSLGAVALDHALLIRAKLEQERLKREMDLAHAIQEQMYPTGMLRTAPVTIAGWSRPCDETGGDYFTYLERTPLLFAMIGDVSGHGLAAALYTTMAHAVIQQQLRAGVGLDPAIAVLNQSLFSTQSGRFMTAALVEIDPGSLAFRYVSAGHNPLLWIDQGEARWLDSGTLPLGIMGEGDFTPSAAQILHPGDYLILYTDGITEAADGEGRFFGEERLAACARAGWQQGLPPDAMLQAIARAVDGWASGHRLEDDLTMVVIAVTPAGAVGAAAP
jgi:sigma-B regulation protein RsbU (phosphoserine phosphatase)